MTAMQRYACAGGTAARLRETLARFALALACLTAPLAVGAACGAFPSDYPVSAGSELDLKQDIVVNGNPVAEGKTGAGSVVEPDGTRGTASPLLPDLEPPTFPANASSTDATEADSPFSSGTEVFYDEVKIDDGSSVTFTGGGPFHIDKLEVKKDSTVYLGAGTYFIDEMKLDDDVVVVIVGEPVLLHIGEKADLKKNLKINQGGSVTALQVFLHDDSEFKADQNLDFTGVIYGPQAKKVEIKKESTVTGLIATGGDVKIEKDTTITLSPADQVAIAGLSTCVGLHLAILHDGAGINCQAEPVAIEVHGQDDAVDTSYTGTITLATSTGNGDWSLIGGSGTLTNSGNGAGSYTFSPADAGEVILGLRNTFVETINIDVTDGTILEDPDEDQAIAFTESGFVFLADGMPGAIGTQIAGKSSAGSPGAQTLELEAVRTSDSTGACEAGLTGIVNVALAYECLDPVACSVRPVTLGATPIAGNGAGALSAYTVVALDFGGATDGTATFSLAYADSGRIRLHALYDLPDALGAPTGNLMVGASNAFVVRPFGFDVDFGGDRAANGTAGASYAADASGSRFAKAGEPFATTVTAVVWSAADDLDLDGQPDAGASLVDNAVTPNFGQELAPASPIMAHSLFAPAAGSAGLLGGDVLVSGFSAGAAVANLTWDEVGIIDLSASLADHLGSGAGVGGETRNVGRFVPARLDVSESGFTFRDGRDPSWSCTFTYLDQPFTFAADPVVTITARNLAGVVTTNYGASYWKLPAPYLTNRVYASTAPGGTSLDAPAAGLVGASGHADLDGVADLTIEDEVFAYRRNTLPVAPFAAQASLTLPASDLTDSDGICHDAGASACDTAAGDTGQGHTITAITGALLRHGRLDLLSAGGSELLALTLPLAATYFDGSGFTRNVDDNCTGLGTAALDLVNDVEDPPLGDPDIAIGAGATTATLAPSTFAAGALGLALSPPGAANTGFAEMTFDLSVATGADLEWLRHDWDGDGTHDDDPMARGTFGVFRGSDNIIFMREPWN